MRAPARPAISPATCPALAAVVLAALAGCTDLPPLPDAEAQRDTGYLALIPADQITGRVPPPGPGADAAPDLIPRAERLRARAARLGGPVIDDATRDRMQTGVVR
ncbi:MAG: hypothetical protein R6V26_05095 [Roseovarius sp.]